MLFESELGLVVINIYCKFLGQTLEFFLKYNWYTKKEGKMESSIGLTPKRKKRQKW